MYKIHKNLKKHCRFKSRECKREDQISGLTAAGGNCPTGRMMESLTYTTHQKQEEMPG